MIRAIALVALATCASAMELDKQAHAWAGAAIGLIAAEYAEARGWSPAQQWLAGSAAATLAGIAREVLPGGNHDERDALATIGGGVLAVSLRWSIKF